MAWGLKLHGKHNRGAGESAPIIVFVNDTSVSVKEREKMERSERIKRANEENAQKAKRWESVEAWGVFLEKAGESALVVAVGVIFFNLAVVAWLLFFGGWETHAPAELAEDGRALVYSVMGGGLAELLKVAGEALRIYAHNKAEHYNRRILRAW